MPSWDALDSVAAPEPDLVDNSAPHPFDAPRRWQVLILAVVVLALLVLSIAGLWQLAVWSLVVVLAGLAGFRAVNRHAWTRARGTIFDVIVLLFAAAGIAVVMLVLPE